VTAQQHFDDLVAAGVSPQIIKVHPDNICADDDDEEQFAC